LEAVLEDKVVMATIGICAIVGLYKIAKTSLCVLGSFNRHLLRRTDDFKQKYGGKDSYVVVTGGSDGIGLEICR
jgi:hypothetical protein